VALVKKGAEYETTPLQTILNQESELQSAAEDR
jgi:hypothetical protein